MSFPNNSPELLEKDFIHEPKNTHGFPFWIWLFLLTVALSVFWGLGNWYSDKINLLFRESPFLQVTNRDISLFLWQNPEYMRVNAKEKGNYLPAFKYIDKVTIDVAYSDQYASAPPELLFRYHTWNRLLKEEFTERPISVGNFLDFLSYAEEWQPNYWPDAPKEYIQLVESLSTTKVDDLSKLSINELPLEVRIAFQGWGNYFNEGEAINSIELSQKQLKDFLNSHPHYARNYWQNILKDAIPNYLKSTEAGLQSDEMRVSSNELSSFLKVAIYNYLQAAKSAQQSSQSPSVKQKSVELNKEQQRGNSRQEFTPRL